MFSIVTKPCFEKRPGNISVEAFFNKKMVLHLAGADNNANSELNNIIHNSISQGVETGSWFNAELTDGLGKILDTTTDEIQLAYKQALLDSNNIGWHYWPYKKLGSERNIVTFSKPTYYDSVITYANAPKKNFEDIRKKRPANTIEIQKALDAFLENCRFKNCIQNIGYIKALGFKPTE